MANWLNEHWFHIRLMVSIWTAGNQLWRWQLVTICNFSRACLKGRPLQCTDPLALQCRTNRCRGEKNAWLNHPLGEMVLECWRWKKWVSRRIQVEAAFPLSGVAPQGGEVVGVINLVTNAFSAVKVMKSWCFDSVFCWHSEMGHFGRLRKMPLRPLSSTHAPMHVP